MQLGCSVEELRQANRNLWGLNAQEMWFSLLYLTLFEVLSTHKEHLENRLHFQECYRIPKISCEVNICVGLSVAWSYLARLASVV